MLETLNSEFLSVILVILATIHKTYDLTRWVESAAFQCPSTSAPQLP